MGSDRRSEWDARSARHTQPRLAGRINTDAPENLFQFGMEGIGSSGERTGQMLSALLLNREAANASHRPVFAGSFAGARHRQRDPAVQEVSREIEGERTTMEKETVQTLSQRKGELNMGKDRLKILVGDCRETLKTLPAASVHTCVTSPPYY